MCVYSRGRQVPSLGRSSHSQAGDSALCGLCLVFPLGMAGNPMPQSPTVQLCARFPGLMSSSPRDEAISRAQPAPHNPHLSAPPQASSPKSFSCDPALPPFPTRLSYLTISLPSSQEGSPTLGLSGSPQGYRAPCDGTRAQEILTHQPWDKQK